MEADKLEKRVYKLVLTGGKYNLFLLFFNILNVRLISWQRHAQCRTHV